MSSLLTAGVWRRYRRSGSVEARREHAAWRVQQGGREWELSPRTFALLYEQSEGAWSSVPRDVWACRLGTLGYVGGGVKASTGEWLLTWADGVALERLDDEKRELWAVSDAVFSSRYSVVVDGSSHPEAETKEIKVAIITTTTTASELSVKAEPPTGEDKFVIGAVSLQGKREENEDRDLQECDWKNSMALFGVFDGHGGHKASKFCAKKLPDILEKHLDNFIDDPNKAFVETFVKLDKKYLKKHNDDGSTACVCLCDKASGKLWVANAGDSRAILVRGDASVEELSTDHKPNLPKEKERIEARGFTVTTETLVQHGKRVKVARVDNKLALSRAIGDDQFKDEDEEPADRAVTAVPDVRASSIERGQFVVLACDGLWDVMSNDQVAKWLFENDAKSTDLNALSKALAEHAINKLGSDDNVSIVIFARK